MTRQFCGLEFESESGKRPSRQRRFAGRCTLEMHALPAQGSRGGDVVLHIVDEQQVGGRDAEALRSESICSPCVGTRVASQTSKSAARCASGQTGAVDARDWEAWAWLMDNPFYKPMTPMFLFP